MNCKLPVQKGWVVDPIFWITCKVFVKISENSALEYILFLFFVEIPKGKYSVVFISPEMALSRRWRMLFLSEEMSDKLCVFACDEAHCLSEW